MVDFLATSAFTLFVPYIAYYFAGLYCVRVLANRPAPYGIVLAGAILITTLFTALSVSVNGLENRWSFYFYEDLSPTIMVMAVTVFMVLLRASLSPTVQSVAQRLAPWTLGVYVAHPIVVELLRNLYHTTMPTMFRPLYYIPITFVATIAITFTAVALMQRVPLLRRVI
jgi:surface polysaccharide O-acyltransferase-like enzyme